MSGSASHSRRAGLRAACFWSLKLGWVFLILLLSACATATPTVQPAAQQSISVVMDTNYPPYSFLGSNGQLQGILIDQWNLWQQKTGIQVKIYATDWGDALKRMEGGEFDVIDTLFYNDQRAKIYDFTKPYASIDVPIFFSNNITGISNAGDLKGFPVAVKSGDAAIDFLKSQGVEQILEFNSYEAIISAAKEQKVIVFMVDQPPAMYYLYKLGIQSEFNYTQPLYSGEFHRAVRKGNTAMLQTVEQGFARISSAEYAAIDQKWMGQNMPERSWSPIWGYIGMLGAAAAGFLLLLLVWNYTLRRRVTRQTRDLQQALDKLRQSEQKYHQLVNNLPGVVYRCAPGPAWTFQYLSNEVARYGYSVAEWVDQKERGLPNLIIPSERDAVIEAMQRGIQLDGKFIMDMRLLTAGGAPCWVNNRGQAVFNRQNQVESIEGIFFDITERKRTEQALLESEERLRLTIDSMDDLVFVYDQERRILEFYYSGPEEQLFRPAAAIRNRTMEELDFPADILEQFNRAFDRLQAGGATQVFDYILPGPGGERWFSAHLTRRLDENEQFAGVTSVIRDITDRKRVEEALREREEEARRFSRLVTSLTHISMQMTAAPSPDELFRLAVERGMAELGFERIGIWLRDEADPRFIVGTFGVDEQGLLRDERQRRLWLDPSDISYQILTAQNPLIYASDRNLVNDHSGIIGRGELVMAAIWDGHKVIGFISIDNLLTKTNIDAAHRETLTLFAQLLGHLFVLKKTEAALRQLNAELEQRVQKRTAQLENSYNEIQSFSYSISHDLRAPLRTLNSFSQILQEEFSAALDPQARDYLNRIRAASTHMSNLMDALLKLARISRNEIQPIPVSLTALAQQIAADLAVEQPQRQVEWVISAELNCQADPALMRAVMENLLGNALKFSARHAQTRIEVGSLENHGETTYFVRDDGAGFDMSYSNKLFGAFQRLHSVSEFEGTGIGLAIVKRIIHRHGGEIWAEGAIDKGATFFFTLPDNH